MKCYSVTSIYFDSGKASAFPPEEHDLPTLPEDTFESCRTFDKYVEWYDSEEAARSFYEYLKMSI